MEVSLIDWLGDDLTVVNAARVSHAKQVSYNPASEGVRLADANLIRYLAINGHDSPFYHPQLTFRISAPIYVARQLMRHHIGLAVNEVSRRYVATPPDFYWPDLRAAGTKKQGSLPEEVPDAGLLKARIQDMAFMLRILYADLLAAGVAPECARAVLPLATETEWIWTGSLFAFASMYRRRTTPDVQRETRDVMYDMRTNIRGIFPVSWDALTERWSIDDSS